MGSFMKLMQKDAAAIINILDTRGMQAARRIFDDQTHSKYSKSAVLTEIAKTGGELGRQFVSNYPEGEQILRELQAQKQEQRHI